MNFIKPGSNKRVCAFFIDSLIFELIGFACFAIVASNVSWIIWTVGIIFKDCANGQSLGKRVVGTQVIDEANAPAEPFKTITRNLTMALPVFPLVEYVVMLRDKQDGRRLGDKMAQTRVTDLKPEVEDSIFLWVSIGLAVLMIVVKLVFGAYITTAHPELMDRHAGVFNY